MPVITDILSQKKNKKYYSIYVDNIYSFSLSQDDLDFLQLKKNTTLSQDKLQTLIHTYALQKAKNYAYKLVAGKSYSEKEIRDKLIEKFPEKISMELVEDLKNYGYINDEKLIYVYAKNKIELKPMGKMKLKNILYNKKFDESLIQQTLDKVYHHFNEQEMAQQLVEKHFKKIKDKDSIKIKNKIKNYLLSNGFNYDTINTIIQGSQKER